MLINGKNLIDWGFKPGPWFGRALEVANRVKGEGFSHDEVLEVIREFEPKADATAIPMRASPQKFYVNLDTPEHEGERTNVDAVKAHMNELMRVPTIVAGAVMPDACPAGQALGTIPVGGVIAAENAIHPGMHSADICCSMYCTIFDEVDPTSVLDAGMKLSHFGPGGRTSTNKLMHPSDDLLVKFEANQYLRMTSEAAIKHYGTQGDGNHFFFVGRVASSGELAIVTHHGSRKPGALLYKAGMAKAESYRKKLAPEVPKHNAWIPADTQDGEDYWWALQLIREWTKGNHRAIHGAVADYLKLRVRDRFWNEHNFVFQKSDGLFYHAKGATPAYPYFSNDTDGRTLIPLNMAQPVLITEGLNADNGLGFAPHGAGRNYSRTQFMKTVGDRNQFIKV